MDISILAEPCFGGGDCPDNISECFSREESHCSGGTYSDRYDNPSAAWVVICAILMFFMKAGFLYVEESFSKSDRVFRRRVVLAKYVDIFAGTLGFWLFGYAISGNTDAAALGEDQDYIFWFFRFTFASNTATILGGTLVGQGVQMRVLAVFFYSFCMTAFIHPSLARFFWSAARSEPAALTWSPYEYCNGTFSAKIDHSFSSHSSGADLGDFVFIDFAGSGLVHLCGGIGGFCLAVFHKLETGRKTRKVLDLIPMLRRTEPAPGNLSDYVNMSLISRPYAVASIQKDNHVVTTGELPDTPDKPKNFIEWMYPSGGGDENVESAALGILILWTTWFAFNAGSTESISGKITHAAVGRIALTMCLAAASGGLTQTIISALVQIYKRDETFNANEIANGVLACLVAVTGCCPFIDPPWALVIGAITIGVYHLGCFIEYRLKIHDGARVFPVHGMCGFWGVLCVGIFSQSCLIQELYEDLCFCVTLDLPDSISTQGLRIAYQLAGGLFIILWSLVFCGIVFSIMWFFPVRLVTYMLGLPWIFRFKNEQRGLITFEGNILFTHFNEIGAPGGAPEPLRQAAPGINVSQAEFGSNKHDKVV